jgi:hypothetical protein
MEEKSPSPRKSSCRGVNKSRSGKEIQNEHVAARIIEGMLIHLEAFDSDRSK